MRLKGLVLGQSPAWTPQPQPYSLASSVPTALHVLRPTTNGILVSQFCLSIGVSLGVDQCVFSLDANGASAVHELCNLTLSIISFGERCGGETYP